MIPWLKAILYDQATFVQYARFVVFALGEVLGNSPDIPGLPSGTGWVAGKGLQAAALLLKSSFQPPALPKA